MPTTLRPKENLEAAWVGEASVFRICGMEAVAECVPQSRQGYVDMVCAKHWTAELRSPGQLKPGQGEQHPRPQGSSEGLSFPLAVDDVIHGNQHWLLACDTENDTQPFCLAGSGSWAGGGSGSVAPVSAWSSSKHAGGERLLGTAHSTLPGHHVLDALAVVTQEAGRPLLPTAFLLRTLLLPQDPIVPL